MKSKNAVLIGLIASCAFGFEIKPDSLSLAFGGFDTITLYNNANDQIQIDTIFIKFQNGDSVDFKRGKACDSTNVSCYNYSGWSYGWSASSAMAISLRYMKDSLFLLQNSTGNPIEYTISPHDSLQFVVSTIVNCPACDRMPIFPATTKFQYTFITNDGQKASFILTLNQLTKVGPIQNPQRYLPAGRLGALYNLGNAGRADAYALTGKKLSLGTRKGMQVILEVRADLKGKLIKKISR